MRIGLIAHHVAPIRPPFGGGVESFTWYLALWLAHRGHDVVMWAPHGSHVPRVELRPLDLDVPFSDAARNDVSMPPDAFMAAHHAYSRVVAEIARDPQPFDVVHSNTLHYLPLLMASTLRTPMLTTLHTPPTPWLESALRLVCAHSTPTLSAVSAATRDAWAPVVGGATVVRNGVDTRRWRRGPGGDRVVWSGRIVPEKAPHLAIEACRAAGRSLRLAGPIIDREYWAAEVLPRLGGDVEYVGHLGHDQLRRLIGHAGVALVTPVWDEPFGLVAAEAMACGTPVAGFDRGGLRDLVGDVGGCLVPGCDPVSLVPAIEAASRLDRNVVRDHAVRTVGIDAMGHGYERLYAQLLERAIPLPPRDPPRPTVPAPIAALAAGPSSPTDAPLAAAS